MFLFHFYFQRYLNIIAALGVQIWFYSWKNHWYCSRFIRSLEKRNGFILYTFEVVSDFITSIALERHMKTYDCQLLNMHVMNNCSQKSFDRTYFVKESAHIFYWIPCPCFPYYIIIFEISYVLEHSFGTCERLALEQILRRCLFEPLF